MKFLIVLLTIISISVLGNDKPLRLGVVNLTHSHVGWVFDSQKNGDFVIAGIVEPNKEVVEKYRKRYGFSPQIVYSSLDEMLDVQKPEAVAAFGPIYDHLMIVQTC
jgi:predicted dehydrogenase